MNAEIFGDLAESLISCPRKRGRGDQYGGDSVWVDQTDAQAVQMASLNHESCRFGRAYSLPIRRLSLSPPPRM